MKRPSIRFLAATAIVGLLLSATTQGQAQSPPSAIPDHQLNRNVHQNVGHVTHYVSGHHGNAWHNAAACPHCQGYGHAGRRSGWQPVPFPLDKWLFVDGYCTHSPDHGWAPPQPSPVIRQGAGYVRMVPERWYGQPNNGPAQQFHRAPMVGTPTDTTQLGYYYQHVPSFQPNPGMLPPRPVPSQYHNRSCRTYAPQQVIWTQVQPASTPEPAGEPTPATPENETPVPPSPDSLNSSAMLW